MPAGRSSDAPTEARLQDFDLLHLREAGRQAGSVLAIAPVDKATCAALLERSRESEKSILASVRQSDPAEANGRWMVENFQLIRTAQHQIREFARSLRDYPAVKTEASGGVPRPYALADAFLTAANNIFSTERLEAFVAGLEEKQELQMGEIWALRPALQFAILRRITSLTTDEEHFLPRLIGSLRAIGESEWKVLFESLSVVHGLLSRDPTGSYASMDYESRDYYRNVVTHLAKHSGHSEREIANAAIDLAQGAQRSAAIPNARESHVGYWLIDAGVRVLRTTVGYRPPWTQRVRDFLLNHAEPYYLIGIEITTLAIVATLLEGLDTLTPILGGLLFLLIPATQAAVEFTNNLTTFLLPTRMLPKLDFSEGIPSDCATMVAVPTLLLSEPQVQNLVVDLEIRYLANRSPNLYFALLTDTADSDRPEDARDVLVNACTQLIEALNDKYGTGAVSPFYLFHRHRTYNLSEGRWMGWERKRGKLLDLNQLLRGGFDPFPVKTGDLRVLPQIRYVITLDSDTQLPRGAAHKLIGAIAHPLNRAVLDPGTNMVVAGYGILQPRIGISIQSASSSRLANIYSGQTGFDIYTRAVSDVYQDLFGEGIFTGKGIYEVDAFRSSLENRFPENALLSHDLIEGAYARAGLVSDVELIDDHPTHFSAYSRRKHRWVRGDWQILKWLLLWVPDYRGNIIPNPISLISRWKILDNLRRSLFEPATLALFLASWLWLKGDPAYWTLASVGMLLLPVWARFLFSLLRAPVKSELLVPWLRNTGATFARDHIAALLQIVFLLHQAMLSIDAVGRSILRVFVTKRSLLEWETAAEAKVTDRRKATVDVYLSWSPILAAAIAADVWFLRPTAFPVAARVVFLWFSARWISAWLNRAPRSRDRPLSEEDVRFLRAAAARTWRYFREWSTADTNWLIPDNVREEGVVARRLSPTNLGFLLNARVAAVHFGYLTIPEFAADTLRTFESIRLLPKYRGHLLNWYSTDTFQPLAPAFVSSVDSGNLVACLWTLKQSALKFAEHRPDEEVLWHGVQDIAQLASPDVRGVVESSQPNLGDVLQGVQQLRSQPGTSQAAETEHWDRELVDRLKHGGCWLKEGATEHILNSLRTIASECDRLIAEMDFEFLYNRRKKVLSVGFDVDTETLQLATYDLLASESRIASFVAIAKGDVPQETWFHLGRKHTLFAGQRVLVSWTGTMFEYSMPALWMRHHRNTILRDSIEAAVRIQQTVGRQNHIAWGISESGCAGEQGSEYGYAAFGVRQIALKRFTSEQTVVSPYSTFLALPVTRRAAVKNLRRFASEGCFGTYGFYEAVDHRTGKPQIVRSWMAHHQGMILLSVCNLLFNNVLQDYFHEEPQVRATELLLHERVPALTLLSADESA